MVLDTFGRALTLFLSYSLILLFGLGGPILDPPNQVLLDTFFTLLLFLSLLLSYFVIWARGSHLGPPNQVLLDTFGKALTLFLSYSLIMLFGLGAKTIGDLAHPLLENGTLARVLACGASGFIGRGNEKESFANPF